MFFAGTNNGAFLTRYNRRTGELKEVGAYPRFFSGEPSKDVKERWQWTYPIIYSSADPNVLYTSSQRVWKITNGGDTWEAISGDLSPTRSEDMRGVRRADYARHEQPGDLRDGVFAGAREKRHQSDVGRVRRWPHSRDAGRGKTWTNVTPADMPDLGRVSQIDSSAFDNGTAYVAVKKMLLGDASPYISAPATTASRGRRS